MEPINIQEGLDYSQNVPFARFQIWEQFSRNISATHSPYKNQHQRQPIFIPMPFLLHNRNYSQICHLLVLE